MQVYADVSDGSSLSMFPTSDEGVPFPMQVFPFGNIVSHRSLSVFPMYAIFAVLPSPYMPMKAMASEPALLYALRPVIQPVPPVVAFKAIMP